MTKKYILEIVAILSVLLGCFKASADMVRYNTKYFSHLGELTFNETATFEVNPELTTEEDALDLLKYSKEQFSDGEIIIEMIDEDSDNRAKAITKKLESLGVTAGHDLCPNGYIYLKPSCFWIRIYQNDEPVILNE